MWKKFVSVIEVLDMFRGWEINSEDLEVDYISKIFKRLVFWGKYRG